MHKKLISISVSGLLLLLGACGSIKETQKSQTGEGGEPSAALTGGKADTAGIVEGSQEALGVLKVANETDLATLKTPVNAGGAGLDARAAENIVAYRIGDDGKPNTADDQLFDTLAELDAVPYVAASSFSQLLAYARVKGYVGGQAVWGEIAKFTVNANLKSMMYSDGIFDPALQKVRYVKINATCALDWVEEVKMMHWNGSQNIPQPTALYKSSSNEQIYSVGQGANPETIQNWLVRLRWNSPLAQDCEVTVAVTKDDLTTPVTPPAGVIDFCGNNIDEDGVGGDLVCKSSTGQLPVIRTLTIYNRGANEGIRVDPDGPIDFPGGADAKLRIINKSVWQVYFSGNLTGGWLNEGPDEITSSVGVPGKVILKIPHEQIIVELKRQWPTSETPKKTKLKGTFEVSNKPTMNVELVIYPDYGKQCVTGGNMADSIEQCGGYDKCTVAIATEVKLLNPQTGGVITDYTFLPDQCNSYGDSFSSNFSWTSASNQLYIWNHWSNSTHSMRKQLSLSGTPDNLKGTLEGIAGMSGTLKVAFGHK